MIPMQWQEELSADGLAHIRGAPDGAGPFLAAAELWERTGAGWKTIPVQRTSWRTVWPQSATDVWAVGERGQTAHLGHDGWRQEHFTEGVTGIEIMAWPDGTAWAPVTYGEIYRHGPDGWRSWKPPVLADRHTGVLWGAAPDDVWMHTHRRTTGVPPDLGHWDGQGWTFHSLWKNGYISNMAGSATDDVWAVGHVVKWIGKGALAAHWDGSRWSKVELPTDKRLCDVYVSPAGEVWIAGFDGTLLRGRNGTFEQLEAPRETLNGVYAGPDGSVWILAGGKRVLKANAP